MPSIRVDNTTTPPNSATAAAAVTTPPRSAAAAEAVTTPPSSATAAHTVAVLQLSPAEHRPVGRKDQSVVIGATTLLLLHVIADFTKKTLEIEEEEDYDD